jgi:hypothetical protein
MSDLAFATEGSLPGPFDWRYPENPGVDIDVRQEHGEVLLHYSSSDPLLRVIARRYLTLDAGRHVLSVDKLGLSSGAKLRLACVGEGQKKSEIALSAFNRRKMSFTISAGCVTQELSIAVRAGEGDVGRLELLAHRA